MEINLDINAMETISPPDNRGILHPVDSVKFGWLPTRIIAWMLETVSTPLSLRLELKYEFPIVLSLTADTSSKVELWECNGTPQQRWVFRNNRIHLEINSGTFLIFNFTIHFFVNNLICRYVPWRAKFGRYRWQCSADLSMQWWC